MPTPLLFGRTSCSIENSTNVLVGVPAVTALLQCENCSISTLYRFTTHTHLLSSQSSLTFIRRGFPVKLSLPNRRISSEALAASFRIRDRYWSCLLYRKSGVTLCLATSPTLHRLLINNNSSRDQIKSGVTWCLETSTAPAYRKSGVTLSLATSTVLHHPPNFKSRGAWQNY